MFHFSMEKVKSASRGIFWLGGALPAVGSLFTDFLSPLGPYSFFLALLLGMLTVLALIAAMIPPVNRVLHSWSAHWAEGVLAVLLCGFLVFSGMFALELSTDPHKGFLASESEKLAEIQKILLNIADTTRKIEQHTAQTASNTAKIAEAAQVTAQNTATSAARTTSIDNKLTNLKKETSDDPRKELVNLGVRYNSDGFYIALESGDERVIDLFLQAGMDFYEPYPNGRPFIKRICEHMGVNYVGKCIRGLRAALRNKINMNKRIKLEEEMESLPQELRKKLFVDDSYTIIDHVLMNISNDAFDKFEEQITQFINEYNRYCENGIKLRRVFCGFLQAELKKRNDNDREAFAFVNQYEQTTRKLEEVMGVSR